MQNVLFRLSETPGEIRCAGPRASGSDTEEVLGELGIGPDEVRGAAADGGGVSRRLDPRPGCTCPVTGPNCWPRPGRRGRRGGDRPGGRRAGGPEGRGARPHRRAARRACRRTTACRSGSGSTRARTEHGRRRRRRARRPPARRPAGAEGRRSPAEIREVAERTGAPLQSCSRALGVERARDWPSAHGWSSASGSARPTSRRTCWSDRDEGLTWARGPRRGGGRAPPGCPSPVQSVWTDVARPGRAAGQQRDRPRHGLLRPLGHPPAPDRPSSTRRSRRSAEEIAARATPSSTTAAAGGRARGGRRARRPTAGSSTPPSCARARTVLDRAGAERTARSRRHRPRAGEAP